MFFQHGEKMIILKNQLGVFFFQPVHLCCWNKTPISPCGRHARSIPCVSFISVLFSGLSFSSPSSFLSFCNRTRWSRMFGIQEKSISSRIKQFYTLFLECNWSWEQICFDSNADFHHTTFSWGYHSGSSLSDPDLLLKNEGLTSQRGSEEMLRKTLRLTRLDSCCWGDQNSS